MCMSMERKGTGILHRPDSGRFLPLPFPIHQWSLKEAGFLESVDSWVFLRWAAEGNRGLPTERATFPPIPLRAQ